MKPQSLQTRNRIQARQEAALEQIRLSHEKEDWTPIEPFEVLLPTDAILERSEPRYVAIMGQPDTILRRFMRWMKGY